MVWVQPESSQQPQPSQQASAGPLTQGLANGHRPATNSVPAEFNVAPPGPMTRGLAERDPAATNGHAAGEVDVEAQNQNQLPPQSLQPVHDFYHPRGVKRKHRKYLRIFGRIGWLFKATVYAIIGGMACKSGAGDNAAAANTSVSPQGAFILVGSNNIGTGLLVVMTVGLCFYAIWRFWEGITGQGADAMFGNFKNFFRFRLSPVVSGGVYTAYAAFVLSLVFQKEDARQNRVENQSFPASWQHTGIGKFGLALCGLAFVIATITQVQQVLTCAYYSDLREDLPRWGRWCTYVLGTLGILARGGVFMFTAILFFRQIGTPSGAGKTVVGDALESLRRKPGGRVGLFILGFGLILYGCFATLMACVRIFPTAPPSRIPKAWAIEGKSGLDSIPPELLASKKVRLKGGRNHGIKSLDSTEDRDSPSYRAAHPGFREYVHSFYPGQASTNGPPTNGAAAMPATTEMQPMSTHVVHN